MLALLFFLICAMVGSVILAAANSSVGRASKTDTEANLQRYSLESAAQMIVQAYQNEEKDINNADFSIEESWKLLKVKADFCTSKSETTLDGHYWSKDTISSPVYLCESNSDYTTDYNSDATALKTYGDYVMLVDETGTTFTTFDAKKKYGFPQLEELADINKYQSDTTFLSDYSWTDKWTGATIDYIKGTITNNSGVRTKDDTATSLVNTVTFKGLGLLRNQMAELIFRHYWYDINNTTEEKALNDGSSEDGTGTDPWKKVKPANLTYKEWKTLVNSKGTYMVQTDPENPILIDASNVSGSIKNVYADFSMDQDLTMIIHLQCGGNQSEDNSSAGTDSGSTQDSASSETSESENLSSSLWIIYEYPEETSDNYIVSFSQIKNDSLSFTLEGKSNPKDLSPLYVKVASDEYVIEASSDPSIGTIKNKISEQWGSGCIFYMGSDTYTSKEDSTPDITTDTNYVYTYDYDVYQLIFGSAKETETEYTRSVNFAVNWGNADITSINPDESSDSASEATTTN